MATAIVTPDQDAVIADIFIAAPPERVFKAITDPTQLTQWWGQKGMYRSKKWEADLRPGGKWRCDGLNDKGDPFTVEGDYLEVDPPRRLVYTWIAPWAGSLKTTVHWELTPSNNGTKVNLHHTGFKTLPDAARNHGEGWTRVLGWMQAYAERGETVDSREAVNIG